MVDSVDSREYLFLLPRRVRESNLTQTLEIASVEPTLVTDVMPIRTQAGRFLCNYLG